MKPAAYLDTLDYFPLSTLQYIQIYQNSAREATDWVHISPGAKKAA